MTFLSKGEKCPICSSKSFDVIQVPYDISKFGKTLLFIMRCSSCHYKNTDVLSLEHKKPVKYTIVINSKKDMNIRVIKSSVAKLIIPGIIELEGGSLSEGYISNVEGVLLRLINIIRLAKSGDINNTTKEKAEEHIRKLANVIEGRGSISLILEDRTGTSAIISEKATKEEASQDTLGGQ